MKKITIAICEEQSDYRERLAEYLIRKKGGQVQVLTFSEKALFVGKCTEKKTEHYDIVLLGRGFWSAFPKEKTDSLYIYLSEDPDQTGDTEPVIFKYQSAEKILRNIFEYYLERRKENSYFCRQKKEIIGIYSPTHSRIRTPFAMTLAQVFGEEKKSLYVNLGEWAGLGSWFGEEFRRDLADLLYLLTDYGTDVQGLLECVVHSMDKMDYIPPMEDAQLLCRTSPEDYQTLLKLLVEKTDYEAIFLDFGIMVPGFFTLLEKCTGIYGVIGRGTMARGQCRQFEAGMVKNGMEHLAEKMTYVPFSLAEEQLMEQEPVVSQWVYGILGDRARNIRYARYGKD